MRRLVAVILLTVLAVPAIPAVAQDTSPETNHIVWACTIDSECTWTYNTSPRPDIHRPQALADFSASCSRIWRFANNALLSYIQCRLDMTPTQGELQPVRYRVTAIDNDSKATVKILTATNAGGEQTPSGQTRKKGQYLHLPPTNLSSLVYLSDAASNSTLIFKVQAIGDCKRQAKRDAGAETCSRFKSPVNKAVAPVT